MIATNSSQLVAIFGMTDATRPAYSAERPDDPLGAAYLTTEVVTVGD
jgi:hypothetical protein